MHVLIQHYSFMSGGKTAYLDKEKLPRPFLG